jgi:hypothetical protein
MVVAARPPAYLRVLLSSAKKRSVKLHRDFSITIQDLESQFRCQGGLCAYTGLRLDIAPYKTGVPVSEEVRPIRASLDRIDNLRGYVPDNIQFVCAAVNMMKADLSSEKFIWFCRLISGVS